MYPLDPLNQNDAIDQIATDSVNKNRLVWATVGGGLLYTGTSIGLYHSWYKDYPRSQFHFFNDFKEWRGMDKAGHIYSGYFQSSWARDIFEWVGFDKDKSLIYGSLSSLLFLTTIEVMDGFSTEWGFSASDFGANVLGISTFALQERYWGNQKIRIKASFWPPNYEKQVDTEGGLINLAHRAKDLYGNLWAEQLLKDYNAQTYWLSINLKGIFPKSRLPSWLNFAMGYGAENLFGGFDNIWNQEDKTFSLEETHYTRYSQFFISLDIDLSAIEVNSPFVRTLLDILNILKVPFSAIEINTRGEVNFKWIHW